MRLCTDVRLLFINHALGKRGALCWQDMDDVTRGEPLESARTVQRALVALSKYARPRTATSRHLRLGFAQRTSWSPPLATARDPPSHQGGGQGVCNGLSFLPMSPPSVSETGLFVTTTYSCQECVPA
jgi:hypothetical protein